MTDQKTAALSVTVTLVLTLRFSLQLFYFEKQTDKDPVGVIILEGCTVELAEEEIDKFAFKITFHGEGRRVYTMGTDDSVSFQVPSQFY